MRPHWTDNDKLVLSKEYSSLIRLNRNENTDTIYINQINNLATQLSGSNNLYPDYNKLYYTLANHLNINHNKILFTCGCDGALKQIFEMLRGYEMHSFFDVTYPGAVYYINRYHGSNNKKAVYICNPNNPTGECISENDLVKCLEMYDFVILDETYYEFHGSTYAHLIDEYNNLMITRSFSKAWGLAGHRCGYIISNNDIIRTLCQDRVMSPFSSTSVELILKLIDRYSYVTDSIARLRAGVNYLYNIYRRYGFDIYDTRGMNFIYAKLPDKLIAQIKRFALINTKAENWCIITCLPIDQIKEFKWLTLY